MHSEICGRFIMFSPLMVSSIAGRRSPFIYDGLVTAASQDLRFMQSELGSVVSKVREKLQSLN